MGRRKTNQRAFLAAFALTGRIDQAAKAAGLDRGAHYDWRDKDPEYPALFAAASERAADAVEDECKRRAFEGVLQAEWYQGKACGTKRVYSDALAMQILRALKPDKYRQGLELTGAYGGAIAVTDKRLTRLTDDELATLKSLHARLTEADTSDARPRDADNARDSGGRTTPRAQ